MQGILNASRYLDFLAEARIDQMTRCYKISLDHYMKKNQSWVFSSVSINFLRPVLFGQKIRVETEVISIDGAMAVVDFRYSDLDRVRDHAKGTAPYHLIDLSTKKPIPVDAEEAAIFLKSSQ